VHDPCFAYQELEARSLRKSLFLRRERDVWDQLRQQKDLLANANKLLSARSAEVEDHRLHCADMKAEAATAREQAALWWRGSRSWRRS
jgi:predicted AAA+ superfamily ATPase